MEDPSVPARPQPEHRPYLPPGLEMSRGLLYFALVFMVFMFMQMVTLVWRVIALSPGLADEGVSLALLDTPAFQERWTALIGNGDVLSLVSLMAGGVALALLLWLVYRWKGKRMGFFLALGFPRLRTMLIWTGFFVVLFAAVEALTLILPEMNSEFMRDVLATVSNYPLMFVGLGLMPALFEELLLRGLLYGSLRHLLDKHVAVAIVAGVFTLIHQQYDWYLLLLYVLPFGIFLGYARANTGSIWVSVFLHLLNNVASMLLPH